MVFKMIEKIYSFFKIKENNSSIKIETIAGLTTFMTMSYIIFVEPTLLSMTGMNFDSVMVATCISSAIGTLLMAVLANYPIALGAAMGHNIFFTFTVCSVTAGGLAFGWQAALAAVFCAGIIYFLLTLIGIREKLLNGVPNPLKQGIACGIGLFITFIGLQWSGIIVGNPGSLVKLGDIHSAPVLLSIFGLLVTSILMSLRIRGAILFGIIITIALGIPFGVVQFYGIVNMPPSISPTFLKLDFNGLFAHKNFIDVIVIFLFLHIFDAIGTLIGVTKQAGLLDAEGKLPRGQKALLADSTSAIIGSLLGCSTITPYVESSAGVSAGARTGFASVITSLMFLLALFFSPLIKSVGEGYHVSPELTLYPVIAPALIIVGSFMIKNIKDIDWDNLTDAIPAFLTAIIMPFAFSITEGISWGFISYTILKVATGQGKNIHWMIYLFTALFIARYIFLIG